MVWGFLTHRDYEHELTDSMTIDGFEEAFPGVKLCKIIHIGNELSIGQYESPILTFLVFLGATKKGITGWLYRYVKDVHMICFMPDITKINGRKIPMSIKLM